METQILLGTQGWSYQDWVGSFYPAGSRAGDFLRIYSQSFSTVEVDSTFYGVPRRSMIDSWRRNSPETFRFAAKLPQVITHERRLVDVETEVLGFLETMQHLEQRLGPLVVQLPPDFRRGQAEQAAFERFLAVLPVGPEYAVEFRHRSWATAEIFDLLRKHEVAWCINDLSYLCPVVEITADFAYLRWLGDHRKLSRFGQVQIDRTASYDKWAEVMRNLASRVSRVYGYFNNHYAGHSPSSVRELQRRLGLPESLPPARGLFD